MFMFVCFVSSRTLVVIPRSPAGGATSALVIHSLQNVKGQVLFFFCTAYPQHVYGCRVKWRAGVSHAGGTRPPVAVLPLQAAGAVHGLGHVPVAAGDHRRPVLPKQLVAAHSPAVLLSVLLSCLLAAEWRDLTHHVLLPPAAQRRPLLDVVSHLGSDIVNCIGSRNNMFIYTYTHIII